MTTNTAAPIDVRHLFRPLDEALIALLQSLSPEDWRQQTVARLWKVKDVAAHLLDGNIRALSIQRDRYFGETPPADPSFEVLTAWLNGLNADWVKASRRISPSVLLLLHQATGKLTTDYYESLDPDNEAIFAVSWAGEEKSLNWMHVAREYTEKWLHQQQIREATGKDGIMTRKFFFPMIDTFFRALPYTLRDTNAPTGTTLKVTIASVIGGDWYLRKSTDGWNFCQRPGSEAYAATISLPPPIAWKLFSKSIRPADCRNDIQVTGDSVLAEDVLNMVSVMA
jgi:uncharacterized protein (TIGR03083 family)